MSAFIFEREIFGTLRNVAEVREGFWRADCPVVPDHELSIGAGYARLAAHGSDAAKTGFVLHCYSCQGADVQQAIQSRLNGTPVEWKVERNGAVQARSGVEAWYIEKPDGSRGAFIPPRAAAWLKAHGHILHGEDGRLYHYADGVYKPDGEIWIAVKLRELEGESFRENHVSEVVAWQQAHEQIEVGYGDPEIINVLNGRLKWRTGELLPHTPELITAIQLPVMYDPAARCPTIDRFLDDVLPEPAMQGLIEEISGLLLIPDPTFRKAFFMSGDGQNGKTTVLNLFSAMLGNSVSAEPLQDLSESRFSKAKLYGKLANICGDIDYRAIRDSATFKQITGNEDKVSAEFKYRDPFEFKPIARLVFSANTLPRSSDTTSGYFDRWLIVPFNYRVPDDRKDGDLGDKITRPAELSGWLNRAVAGLQRLKTRKIFNEPESVKQALAEYRLEADPVSAFAAAKLVEGGESARVSADDMYKQFTSWCYVEGREGLNKNNFATRLERLGFERFRTATVRGWKNVIVRTGSISSP